MPRSVPRLASSRSRVRSALRVPAALAVIALSACSTGSLGPSADPSVGPAVDPAEVESTSPSPASSTTAGRSASMPPADLVMWGGKIVTMDPVRPEAEALAVRDGRVVTLGSRAAIEELVGTDTEVLDLDGALAIPGFVEAHGHFLSLGDARIQLDLRSASSWSEIVEQVRRAAAEAEPGEWIRGRGWHQDKWNEAPAVVVDGFPTHDALSEASPRNPVLLTHASGHALLANAVAMERAGVTDDTADPPGGDIVRDASGRATGLFNETSQSLIHAARGTGAREFSDSEMARIVELATEESRRKGVTSFHDAGLGFAAIDALETLARSGALGVRLWVMVGEGNEELAQGLAEAQGERVEGLLTVGGIKRYMDGALGSRGAWLLEPYADDHDNHGIPSMELSDLRITAQIAKAHDVQLCVHAIGDRANREVLDLYEAMLLDTPGRRWRIEHVQHLDPVDAPRFAELGVVASMQPIHATSDGPWVPDRLGDARARDGAYLWRSLVDSGALVVFGTDVPVEDLDPLANFRAAVTRRMADGTAFYPEQALLREEALRAMTADAARSVFQEGEVGTLAPGLHADITVLSHDILTVPEADLERARVVATVFGGEVVYRAEAP